MLKLNLTHAGKSSTIELNGVDISRYFRSISVRTAVNDATQATLEYTGAIVVETDGEITFQQAEHFSTCDECHKVLTGAPHEDVKVIDVSRLTCTSKEYAPVQE
jgi:hypothetical protein